MSWPLVKLRDCCEVVGGATPKREVPEYWDSPDVPWVTPKDVSDLACPTLDDAPEYISVVGFKSCSTSMLPKGSVLVTSRAPIGNIAIAGRDLCTNQGFKSLIPGESVDGLYLYYCMKHSSQRLQALGNGATFKEVSKKIVEEFEIPLPPLPEQKRIAAILDKADAIRRKRQQAIQLADDFLRAVFLDMFGDPVTNPKGWPSVKLGEVCGVGSSKRVFVDEFTDTGVPFYRGTEVGALGEGQKIQAELFISQEHYDDLVSHSGAPEVGDLLLPSICHDGRIWKVNHKEQFYFKDGRVLWIKVNWKLIDSDYLRSYLQRMFFSNYSAIASGTTFAELKIVNLKAMNILSPPLALQRKFSELVKVISDSGKLYATADMEGEDLFSSLAKQAFSGQL